MKRILFLLLLLGFSQVSFAQDYPTFCPIGSNSASRINSCVNAGGTILPFPGRVCQNSGNTYDHVYCLPRGASSSSRSSAASSTPPTCSGHTSLITLPNGNQICECPNRSDFNNGNSCQACDSLPSEDVSWNGGHYDPCDGSGESKNQCSWEQTGDSTCSGQGSTQQCTAQWSPTGQRCSKTIPDSDDNNGGSNSSSPNNGGGGDDGGGSDDGGEDGGTNNSSAASGGSNSSTAGGSAGGGSGSSTGSNNGGGNGGDGNGSGSSAGNGGGSGGSGSNSSGASECKEGEECGGDGNFVGGTCSVENPSAPKCEGDADPVVCAVAIHTWQTECNDKLWREGLVGTDEYRDGDSVLGDGDGKNIVATQEEQFPNLLDQLSKEQFLAAGCPAPLQVNLGKFGTVQFTFDFICDLADMLRPLIIALGAFLSAVILLRGMDKSGGVS